MWDTPQGRKINEWIPAKRTDRDFSARLSRETGAGRGAGDALATRFDHLLMLQEDVPLDKAMSESPVNEDDSSMKDEVPALVADASDSSAPRNP